MSRPGVDARFDLPEKGHEVLGAVLGFAPGDDLAGHHIERGEEIEGAMAHVVVGPTLGFLWRGRSALHPVDKWPTDPSGRPRGCPRASLLHARSTRSYRLTRRIITSGAWATVMPSGCARTANQESPVGIRLPQHVLRGSAAYSTVSFCYDRAQVAEPVTPPRSSRSRALTSSTSRCSCSAALELGKPLQGPGFQRRRVVRNIDLAGTFDLRDSTIQSGD